MPLILIVGLPSAGKSCRAKELKDLLETKYNKSVHLVSDTDVFIRKNIDKNALVFDARKEKEFRDFLKSEVIRLISKDDYVILDSSNYIKGYRYELYCAAKNNKTTSFLVEPIIAKEACWEWNINRPENQRYTKEAFDALHLRYEAPDNRNRWDSPLMSLQDFESIDVKFIESNIFGTSAKPNKSTLPPQIATQDTFSQMEGIMQDIIKEIMVASSNGHRDSVKISKYEDCVVDSVPEHVTNVYLAKLKRQFLNFNKLNADSLNSASRDKKAKMFVTFLNGVMSGAE